MNGYECNGTDILKDEKFYSSQVGKKKNISSFTV